jgi:hypothetical protein
MGKHARATAMALMFKATERKRLMWMSVFTGAKIRKAIIQRAGLHFFCRSIRQGIE